MKKLAINPNNKRYYSYEYIKGWEDGVKAQYEATIDAVEVVRCKDCKLRKKNKFCLEHNRYEKNDSGFCSYGERRQP